MNSNEKPQPVGDEVRLRQIVNASMQISDSMASVSFAAGDTRDINERIMSITAAVEQSSSAIEEIAHAAERSSTFAGDCNRSMDKARGAFGETEEAVLKVAEHAKINLDQSKELEKESKEITEIVDIISGIANQTRMLALNANIEAARAGEAGRGFSVVASEVKNLSVETQAATERIAHTIKGIQTQLQEMVSRMKTTQDCAEDGRSSLVQAADCIGDSCHKMEEVSSQAQSMAASVTEQSASMNEITTAAAEIAELADKATVNSESALDSVSKTESIVNGQFEEISGVDPNLLVLYRAQADHFLWKKHLAELLAGRSALNSVELKDCHQCRLGNWYDKALHEERFKSSPLFVDLYEPHRRVHELGRLASERYAQNDRARAIDAYRELEHESEQVVRLLNELIEEENAGKNLE